MNFDKIAKTIKVKAKRAWANVYSRQLIIAFGLLILFWLVTSLFLNIITQHGITQPVPEFRGMMIDDAITKADDSNLEIQIADSIYIPGRQAGMIIDQNPKPDMQVKKGRKIFVTIITRTPKLSNVPNVVGYSLRQAKAIIESQGFVVGHLQYVSDIATNNVLEQRFKGRSLNSSVKIPVGSAIEFVVGLSQGDVTDVPNVVGQTFGGARSSIIESYLNVGEARFDESVHNSIDSIEAKVYYQNPSVGTKLGLGKKVSIYLSKNSKKKPQSWMMVSPNGADTVSTTVDTSATAEEQPAEENL
jgi:eukaryotic-like serine/threonine-protein kinase